jgi:NAD(P)-dependent dehydrogenase (short-subunit alcohol dehydrogenase family)
VAVVLGVGPGLGGAVARRFVREGFAVAIMARSGETLAPAEAAIHENGGTSIAITTDAADPEAMHEAFAKVRRDLGHPEVFVYNAGAFRPAGLLEISPTDFERAWKVNCFGGFLGAREVLPSMIDRGHGTILFTGATGSLRGGARFSMLAVGKFGLRALAQSIAREFGPKGIHVAHVVVDGQIDTPRTRLYAPDRETNSFLSPDAIAETYWQLHAQHPTAWTLELDIRPSIEKF